MKVKSTMVLVMSGLFCLPITVYAENQEREQEEQELQQKSMTQEQDQKMMYGWELMTVKEREEHQAKMRSLKTEEERTAYRQEHHKQMQMRAKEQGVTIPDVPPQRGAGAGPGGGQGTGGGQGKK